MLQRDLKRLYTVNKKVLIDASSCLSRTLNLHSHQVIVSHLQETEHSAVQYFHHYIVSTPCECWSWQEAGI